MSHYEPTFFDSHDRKNYVCATGCWGDLYCDTLTGDVVYYDRGGDWKEPGDGYDRITRLDVDEWRRTYPEDDITLGHDILDFGSWDTAGHYEGPEWDWRFHYWHDRQDIKISDAASELYYAWLNEQSPVD